jgi:hypothetical protein
MVRSKLCSDKEFFHGKNKTTEQLVNNLNGILTLAQLLNLLESVNFNPKTL